MVGDVDETAVLGSLVHIRVVSPVAKFLEDDCTSGTQASILKVGTKSLLDKHVSTIELNDGI